MASIEDQVIVPPLPPTSLEMKKKFKDILADDHDLMAAAEVTKIFSQTIESSSPEEEEEEEEEKEIVEAAAAAAVPNVITEIVIQPPDDDEDDLNDDDDEHYFGHKSHSSASNRSIDKVPNDLSHFNETVCDSDDNDVNDDEGEVGKKYLINGSHNNHHHDHQDEDAEDENGQGKEAMEASDGDVLVSDQEQAEIRDFEQMERLVEMQMDQKAMAGVENCTNSNDDNLVRNNNNNNINETKHNLNDDDNDRREEGVMDQVENDNEDEYGMNGNPMDLDRNGDDLWHYKASAESGLRIVEEGEEEEEEIDTDDVLVMDYHEQEQQQQQQLRNDGDNPAVTYSYEETNCGDAVEDDDEEASDDPENWLINNGGPSNDMPNCDDDNKEEEEEEREHKGEEGKSKLMEEEEEESGQEQPLPQQMGIFTSVRELSKIYQENCNRQGSRDRVSTKEELNQIRLSVKTMKSSFSKFDALQKKAAAAAAQQQQQHNTGSAQQAPQAAVATTGRDQESIVCTGCGKVVYQMEQIKAENRYWHRNCFRCTTCQKPLNVDTYQSHEAVLYCKPHFKQLFSPKTVLDDEIEDAGQKKKGLTEMIIRENVPQDLPDGVVRATDKVEDGLSLDDLHRLKNIKQAFQMFEKGPNSMDQNEPMAPVKVEKSQTILNKLAHFQRKMAKEGRKSARNGVTSDDLNGEPQGDNLSGSGSSCGSEDEEDEEPPEGVDVDLWRSRRAIRQSEQIQHCADLDDIKRKFEHNSAETERRDRQEERREEIKRIRSRLFMGKQARIKEQYQQAVMDSEFAGPEAVANRSNADGVAAGNLREKMQLLNEGGCATDASEDGVRHVPTTKQRLLERKNENLLELEELRRQKRNDNQEIKSKFEGGIEKSPSYRADDPEMMAQMVEHGIAKTSRNMFLEIDKQIQQSNAPLSPTLMQPQSVLRKSNSQLLRNNQQVVNNGSTEGGEEGVATSKTVGDEQVVIDTKDLQKKFEFFEKYKEQDRSPKKSQSLALHVTKFKDTTSVKEMFENVNAAKPVSRQESQDEGHAVAKESNTTKKMLNLFREIESGADKRSTDTGPKPLKAFTPPPDGGRRLYNNGHGQNNGGAGDGGGESEEGSDEGGVTDNSDIESEDEEELKRRMGKYDDEVLHQAKQEARAQKLRAKFEKWETEQIKLEQQQQLNARRLHLDELRSSNGGGGGVGGGDGYDAEHQNGDHVDGNQLESAKNLRQKFEFMAKGDTSPSMTSPRKAIVNRFV